MENDSHQDTHNGAEQYRRIELITGSVRRRRWSVEERARIVAESFEPGANISAVARRNGVNGGLLHYWRKQAKAGAYLTGSAGGLPFVPMRVVEATGEGEPCSPTGGVMEIVVKGTVIRVPAGADAGTLTMILAVVRAAS